MTQKAIKPAIKVAVISIIFLIDFLLKQDVPIEQEYVCANIDTGFMIILLLGFSVGGYKLYVQENKQ